MAKIQKMKIQKLIVKFLFFCLFPFQDGVCLEEGQKYLKRRTVWVLIVVGTYSSPYFFISMTMVGLASGLMV